MRVYFDLRQLKCFIDFCQSSGRFYEPPSIMANKHIGTCKYGTGYAY